MISPSPGGDSIYPPTYPPTFEAAFGYLIQNEGGLASDSADSGGVTKYGITRAEFPDIDIPSLTLDQARSIYYSRPPKGSPLPFWVPNYSLIRDARVATKIFDMAVNMGPGTTHEIVQLSVGMRNPTQVFGAITLGIVNKADPASLLDELAARAAVHYGEIVAEYPKDIRFLLGWMRRATKVPR